MAGEVHRGFASVQYGSENLPFRLQTAVTYLLYNKCDNDVNQNYGTRLGLDYVALKEVCVMALILCNLKTCSHSLKFRGYRYPTSFRGDLNSLTNVLMFH